MQQIEESAPLADASKSIDVEAEESQGGLLPGCHGWQGRRPIADSP